MKPLPRDQLLRSRRPSYLRRLGAEVIDGLRFDTDEEWMEACYRHRDIINARQQEKANPEPVEPRKTLCSFCLEPRSPTRPLFRDGFIYICEPCATTAVEAFAAHRRSHERGRDAPAKSAKFGEI
jgi:hypothetical protein